MTAPPPASEQTRTPAAAEQAPAVPGVPTVKKTERPHPATPLIRGWLVLVAIIVYWGRELIPDGEENQFERINLWWILTGVGVMVIIAAVAGLVSWYFTRFIIDDEELRIETGAIFKKSKKIPFERLQSVDIIQPLAARIFGLAELRLEAGAGDSTTKLRYLTRSQSSRLRDYLLARAHGERATIQTSDKTEDASRYTDLGRTDKPLVTVPPDRLVFGLILSSEWLISATLLIIALVGTITFDVVRYALGALIPLAFAVVTMISRRVISMFNFTLAESPRGLRITRGLTNLTSQSVPISRIQGVRVSRPLLWKPKGWYRVDVDVVGYGQGEGEDNDNQATSVLLPVATADEVDLTLSRVLPGFALDEIELHPVPHRVRWLRWFDFWTLRYGWDDRALITENGWMIHQRNIVPHAKTQSVRIEQGPLQRRVRLAHVHVDTPKGPVNVIARHLDADVARELAMTQLDRARAARAADQQHRPVSKVAMDLQAEAQLLAGFGTSRDRLLGGGGETEVFALDQDRVLRLYRAPHDKRDHTVPQLERLYAGWSGVDVGLEVPQILESGLRNGRSYTIDRRFSGRPFAPWLASAPQNERRSALITFLDATEKIKQLPSPVEGFARLVGEEAPDRFVDLGELLHNMLAGRIARSRDRLLRDLDEPGEAWDRLHAEIAERTVEPRLVHGDVCPPNAYLSPGPGGPVVTGIGDFSPHTVNGDPMMDIAGAVIFLELGEYAAAADDAAWLQGVAVERHGPDTAHWIEVYRRFYGFYFSDTFEFDPSTYGWCLRQLDRA